MNLLLPFGNITASLFSLVVAVLLVALVYEIARHVGRLMLNLDHESAPKILTENKVYIAIKKLLDKVAPREDVYDITEGNVLEKFGGFVITDGYFSYYSTGEKSPRTETWSSGSLIREYCVFPTAEDAMRHPLAVATKREKVGETRDVWNIVKTVGSCVLFDLGIFWAMKDFTTFYITALTVGIPLCTRYLSGFIWDHSAKLNKHDDRITKLEGENNDSETKDL